MEVGESGYDDRDGDVFGRSYVCARMEVWTLTRQKDIYSTLTRQKDIYSFSKKKAKRARDVLSAGSRESEEILPFRLNDVGIRGRFQYGIFWRFLFPPTFAGTAPSLAMCALLDTKKIDPKPKITPIAYSHCHKKNTSPRKHGSNQTKRSSLNGRESTTRASIN
jgi:hypothetical protein